MEFQLRACQWCHGIKGAPVGACFGCGHWILTCEYNGLRYAGPYSASAATVVPWVGKPPEAAVEAEKAAMTSWLAAPLIVGAIGETLEAIGC